MFLNVFGKLTLNFYIVAGIANWHSHYGDQCGDSFKNWD